ncbi:haloacid dehalogenase-like hydrolase [Streptomyces sp. NBC_01353]|uniref:haloacid dehalogenase-like hydrolase n=1 Tax=Streptomyces sp. NBC_01353 TaxID=2903835 RepID=UPI002E32E056|nr:haloacid dehalogenase-like hydrolase [Streptomyces sp. NBC_01353]
MNPRFRRITAAAATVLALAGLVTAAPAHARPGKCPTLKASEGWYGDNRARLQELVDAHCGDRGADRPVAVFDWDNTVIKNDVGDATMYWLLRNSRIRPPANDDWTTTSRHLTRDAAAALRDACPTGVRTLPTGTDTRCADEILSVYAEGATTTGSKAFTGFDHRRTEPQYAWLAQLLRGWTTRQVESFAAAARAESLAAPIGATQQVGTGEVSAWVRYYEQQRDLVRTLRTAGFDVWIVSASPEPVVDVWAQGVGIASSHAIGIRNITERGRLGARLKGCGGVRDGEDSMITYIDGKRCWINQEIFGVRGPAAERVQPASRRQVFAAGDSDTDISFLRDATGLRLVLNRNKNELMCRAYDNSDGRWIVNPMFIEPKKQKTSPYPCATTAYTAADGTAQPVRRADGSVVPDQWDSVFGS